MDLNMWKHLEVRHLSEGIYKHMCDKPQAQEPMTYKDAKPCA